MGLHPLCAFVGAARSGKSCAAEALRPLGYVEHSYGTLIKRQAPLLDRHDLWRVLAWSRAHDPDPEALEDDIVDGWMLCTGGWADPFTEDDTIKPLLRPYLERVGAAFYDLLTPAYFKDRPPLAVSCRVLRLREAEDWVRHGGRLIRLSRPGFGPETPFAAAFLADLGASGLPVADVPNDGDRDALRARVREAVAL